MSAKLYKCGGKKGEDSPAVGTLGAVLVVQVLNVLVTAARATNRVKLTKVTRGHHEARVTILHCTRRLVSRHKEYIHKRDI